MPRLHFHSVTLRLPIVPRRYAVGDKRNYRRWHAWVETVRVVSAHFKGARAGARRR